MTRTLTFASSIGEVQGKLPTGAVVQVPVFPGILKHPPADALVPLLGSPAALRKYTLEAIRIASWPILRQFPRDWLIEHLPHAVLVPERRRAILFLLG